MNTPQLFIQPKLIDGEIVLGVNYKGKIRVFTMTPDEAIRCAKDLVSLATTGKLASQEESPCDQSQKPH